MFLKGLLNKILVITFFEKKTNLFYSWSVLQYYVVPCISCTLICSALLYFTLFNLLFYVLLCFAWVCFALLCSTVLY